jgi:hypothetical protein
MANTVIQIRSSGVVGNVPSALFPGELAINYEDGKLYYGNSANQTVLFDAITEPAGLNGELQFNDSGSFGSDATLLFNSNTKLLITAAVQAGSLNVEPAIQSAYLHANSAYEYANALSGGTATDGVARSIANSAYIQANASFQNSNSAIQSATSAGSYANSAYTQANTATTNAATADQRAVTSGSYANSAFAGANTADQKAVTSGDYANSAFSGANTADQKAVTSGDYANSAYAQANNGTTLAQSAYDFANTLSGGGGSTVVIGNDVSTNSEYYITFTDKTSGSISLLNTSDAKLSYIPSSGTISVEAIDVTADATISSRSLENTSGNQFLVDSFDALTYRGAFYQVQIQSPGEYQVLNLNIVHNGSAPTVSTFGSAFTSSSLGTFTATIINGVLQLLFTPNVGLVIVSFIRNVIKKIRDLVPAGDLGYVGDTASVVFDSGYVEDSSSVSFDYGGLD